MLVSEFVKKYDAPKSLVYEASFMTKTRTETPFVTDIPEDDLVDAVLCLLQKHIAYHTMKLNDERELHIRLMRSKA